ncbi:hypothetical protein [Paraburkholderia sediminicola]|uniref:hypothetical protein n=1 Tax=Paraburkholderia sediminicola TaxID=458836 RepID=UPI00131E4830
MKTGLSAESVESRSFKSDLRAYLKNFPTLVKVKRWIWSFVNSTNHDVVLSFPLYAPDSAGRYHGKAALTIQAINQIFPFLSALSASANGKVIQMQNIENFPKTDIEIKAVSDLKILLDKYGSDKATHHNYHNLYGVILKNRRDVRSIFEIGLGTNNPNVISNMVGRGKPGASLRAFRDYCEVADVYGADIDKGVLFNENRIKTFYVDQTDPKTFEDLSDSIPDDIYLMIDDGLHSPNANIESLKFGLKKIMVGGWVVIEDIVPEAMPVWEVVAAILPDRFRSYLFKAEGALAFAVERLN